MSITTNTPCDPARSPSDISLTNHATKERRPFPNSTHRGNMSPHATQLRRSRPSNLQTSIPANSLLLAMPPSAISNSSVTSSSHGSPILSSETTGLTTGSSIAASPELLCGRDADELPTTSFPQLPGPILERKTSANSLHQALLNGHGAMHDIMKPQNLMRRISNKVSNKASHAINKRRTSSTHPISRDGSIGPAILRRRSDSNNALPHPYQNDPTSRSVAVETDSDCDAADEREDLSGLLALDIAGQELSPTSAPSSVAGSTGPPPAPAGPVIPLALLKGTWIRKVSKKNKEKRISLVLEPDSAKITWDKVRPTKCIYIDDIKDIRTAEDIRQYRLDFGIPESEESRFFTIIYTVPDRSQTKKMHLIADDEDTFLNWTMTLDAIYKHRQDSMASLMAFNYKAVRAYWEREMAKQPADKLSAADDGEIDFPGVERICRNLHIHVPQEVLVANFITADATQTCHLNFAEFQVFVKLMKRREDIHAVYRQIAKDPEHGITRNEFLDFLRDTQYENVDDYLTWWEDAFARFARHEKWEDLEAAEPDDALPLMSEDGLAAFLTSTHNLAIAPEPREYTLDRPMNEYFISSSHNTYLLGRQVVGVSSVEGYISALMRGCRCVEIDCWDGPGGEPDVLHGMTWTSRISFLQVINTINKYAFIKSHFPLWISLEVHCNAEQQRRMASIMREVFGAKLVTETIPGSSDHLPSPSELMDRILIKTKKPQHIETLSGRRRGNSLNSPLAKPVVADTSSLSQSLPHSPLASPIPSIRRMTSKTRVKSIAEGEVQEALMSSSSDSESGSDKATKKKQSKIVPELGALAVYCMGLKFTGFDDPDCKAYNHILSFVENTFIRNSRSRDSKRALYRHNMRHLMRVYPNQSRVTSSNFNPLSYWRKGVQMAALNWQTFDIGMQLNQAMFDGGTDQSGYVLKPKEFREIQVLPNTPDMWEGKRERKNVSFTIDVISAQQLMRPYNFAEKRSLDPFVEVDVYVPDEKTDGNSGRYSPGPARPHRLQYRTPIVYGNGFNPIFDHRCTFNFTTKYPDLVFVKMSVKYADNGRYNTANTMATFTAKLTSLQRGYRTIPLLDNNADQYLFSTLFCFIRKEPITSVYVDYNGDEPEGGRFKNIGRNVFNRSSTMSPKTSADGGPS